MRQCKNFEIYKDLFEKPFQRNWVARLVFPIQILLFFGALCNHFFWDIRLKTYMLPNFTMLFQPVITKFSKVNCFHVYRKLITWSSTAKGPLLHLSCYEDVTQILSGNTNHKNLFVGDFCRRSINPIVTKINFLLTISIHCQQISYEN